MGRKILLWIFFCLLSVPTFALRGVGEYSEATNVFEIMDHVSLWHKKLSRVYFNEWSKRFTLSLEDKNYLEQYKDLRQKYHKDIGQGEDLFGEMPIGYDSFSAYFYGTSSQLPARFHR